MDSLATLNVPAIGYGIRYEFGIFDQAIRRRLAGRGHGQVAAFRQPVGNRAPGNRVRSEIRRAHRAVTPTSSGRYRVRWIPEKRGQGRRLRHAGRRLSRAHREHYCACGRPRPPSRSISQAFNRRRLLPRGGRQGRIGEHHEGSLSNDEAEAGKQLRLEQQYFFVSCSLQDMLGCILMRGKPLDELPRQVGRAAERHTSRHRRCRADAPAGGRARNGWDEAWTSPATFAYTNHTLLPEALEKWPLRSVRASCCRAIWRSSTRSIAASWTKSGSAYPGDDARLRRLSLIDEAGEQLRAHGASRVRRQPCDQRRGRAPFRLLKRTVLRDSPSCGRRNSAT